MLLLVLVLVSLIRLPTFILIGGVRPTAEAYGSIILA